MFNYRVIINCSITEIMVMFPIISTCSTKWRWVEVEIYRASNMTRSISITSIQSNVKQSSTLKNADLPRLAEALQLPPTFHCQQRTVFDSMEGLCMLLKRVSYPCRYSDMISRFGRPVSVLSPITNHTLDYIYENHGHLITVEQKYVKSSCLRSFTQQLFQIRQWNRQADLQTTTCSASCL